MHAGLVFCNATTIFDFLDFCHEKSDLFFQLLYTIYCTLKNDTVMTYVLCDYHIITSKSAKFQSVYIKCSYLLEPNFLHKSLPNLKFKT